MDSADPDKAADEDTPKYPGQALKEGATGDLVKLVQKKVGATPDGNWGPKTTYAVKLWQKANGRLDDGIVGPKTWESMFGG
jgi:peptidoglycan hydrolase-like protein with peptidoglycan-binding domain